MMRKQLISAAVALSMLGTTAQAEVHIGEDAPNFTLPDMHGRQVSLNKFRGRFVVLEWTNPECPFVRKHYNSGNMPALQRRYTAKNVVWLSINSGALGREGYRTAAQALATVKAQKAAPSDVLLDHAGTVGHLYDAKTTPHMFLISPTGKLLYMGGIDSIRTNDPADLPKAKNYIAAALDEALAGKPVTEKAAMPYGCSVKYALK